MNTLHRSILLGACLLTTATIAQAQEAGSEPQIQPSSLTRGTEAPAIIAPDTTGVEHSLSEWKGQWVVVDFWASWCRDCRREFPEIKAIAEAYNGKSAFLSVSMDHDAEAWRKCLRQQQFPWTQLSNLQRWKENDIALAYDLHWIPSYFLIDPDGKVWGSYTNAASLQEALTELWAKGE